MANPSLNLVAFDIGAESGRAILGKFNGESLHLSEVSRFANGPFRLPEAGGLRFHLHWDIVKIWNEILKGISLAIQNGDIAGIGLDTWGVDFGLLDRQGNLIGFPYHYRDDRTDGVIDEAFKRVSRAEIFDHTGIQFMQLNTIYQLFAMVLQHSPALESAQTFLTMPDLLNYWLAGLKVCEYTNATTTQCYNTRLSDWAWPLLKSLDIPEHIFPQVVQPGTVLGPLTPAVISILGIQPIPVIAPACHDTGSAVAAIPAQMPNFGWISSGTWSVLGVETRQPIVEERGLAFNMTNEGGVCKTIRFSRNVMGLWLMQECRNLWERQGESFSYADLTQMAETAAPLVSLIDPDSSEFLKPGDMPARIRDFCQRTGQPSPEDKGAMIRCILESLALKYHWVFEIVESILGERVETIHMVGGGIKNKLLSQFTANATGRIVQTGPVEATATGNLLVQALALGEIASLEDMRKVVRQSINLETYEPQDMAAWQDGYARLVNIINTQKIKER